MTTAQRFIRPQLLALLAAILCLAGMPASARAAVLINEVAWMGTTASANAEWIELFNTGGSATSLDGWTLAGSVGTQPLHVALGSCTNKTIAAGGFYLLERTSDSSVPSVPADCVYSGSLSNSGDTLTLIDGAGAQEDQIVGGTNWQNIGGSNTTKQTASRTSSGWITADPTPRAANPDNIVADISSSPTMQSQDSSSAALSSVNGAAKTQSASGGALAPLMDVDLGGDRTVESGAGSFFEGHVYNKDGVPLAATRYLWNFGNGETREGQSAFFAYQYPGTYTVTLAVDAGNGYSTSNSIRVDAVPAEVTLAQGSDGSLAITNTTHGGKALDLSMWVLERGGVSFTIPRSTSILPGVTVRFAPTLLKMPVADSALLLYPDGMVAASTDPSINPHTTGITYEQATVMRDAKQVTRAPKIPAGFSAPPPAEPAPSSSTSSATSTPSASSFTASAHDAGGASGMSPLALASSGLAALVVLGIAGVQYARVGKRYEEGDGLKYVENKGENDDPIARADALAKEFTIVSSDEL